MGRIGNRVGVAAIALVGTVCAAGGAYWLWGRDDPVRRPASVAVETLSAIGPEGSHLVSVSAAGARPCAPARARLAGTEDGNGGVTPASMAIGAEGDACPPLEAVFQAIAETTREASIEEIITALEEVLSHPQGGRDEPSILAVRLRNSLGLSPLTAPCADTLSGVGEALRLARIAAADGATAALRQPYTRVSDIPASTPAGAGGSGYN